MVLTKRTVFTAVTPLPPSIKRSAAVSFLHDHSAIITLNPLVQHFERTTPHPSAPADETSPDCVWYEITDKISYLPLDLWTGEITYKACFYDIPTGCQTHVYAPSGVDIRGRWTVGGNEAGEKREERELGLDAPRDGLYLREDVDLRCSFLLVGFVKSNLEKSHKIMTEKLVTMVEGSKGEGHERQGSKSTQASLESSKNKPLPELPGQTSLQQQSKAGERAVHPAAGAPRTSSHWERPPSRGRVSFQGHHNNVAEQAELSADKSPVHDGRPYVPHSDLDIKYPDGSRSTTPQVSRPSHSRNRSTASQNLDPMTAQHPLLRPRAELQ